MVCEVAVILPEYFEYYFLELLFKQTAQHPTSFWVWPLVAESGWLN